MYGEKTMLLIAYHMRRTTTFFKCGGNGYLRVGCVTSHEIFFLFLVEPFPHFNASFPFPFYPPLLSFPSCFLPFSLA